MWKKAFVGTAALLIAGSVIVYAEHVSGPVKDLKDISGIVDTGIALRPNAGNMAAFPDAQIASLRAGLKLNMDQEKLWPAFERELRDLAKRRTDKLFAIRDQQSFSDPVQQLRHQADALALHRSALMRLADTLAPIYQSFDEGQKHRFAELTSFIRLHPYFGMGQAEANGRNALDENRYQNGSNNIGSTDGVRN